MLPSNWKEQLRYRLDNIFAKGTGALIVLLAVASLAIIFLVSVYVWCCFFIQFLDERRTIRKFV